MGVLADAHCHFFSRAFFAALGGEQAIGKLGWDAPGTAEELADRWAAELDRHGVARAALIASVPGDEGSVAAAVARHPARFVGFFMVDPTADGAAERASGAIDRGGLGTMCLVPAKLRFALPGPRVGHMLAMDAAWHWLVG